MVTINPAPSRNTHKGAVGLSLANANPTLRSWQPSCETPPGEGLGIAMTGEAGVPVCPGEPRNPQESHPLSCSQAVPLLFFSGVALGWDSSRGLLQTLPIIECKVSGMYGGI